MQQIRLTCAEMAAQTYAAVQSHFYDEAANLYIENYPRKADDRQYAGLWTHSGMISALNALARMPDLGDPYHADLRRVLDGLEQYWDGSHTFPSYDSYVRAYGGGQKYYDDNEWLGWDFIEACHTLGEPAYLDKARLMWEFVVSGWSDAMGGGIYWREDDFETKNTCSNGPAAVLALKLYRETPDAQYLVWARRILDWTQQLQTPDGVYWDHIKADGSIDRRIYTYNVGTPLHAAALLYTITGNDRYLQEARQLAADSHNFFTRESGFYPDSPWFNAVLLKGYIALYQADPQPDSRYISAMRANLNHAWQHSRDKNGLFDPDWRGHSDPIKPHYWLLDQAAMIELYALLAQFEGGGV